MDNDGELTIAELIDLERTGLQALIDTFTEDSIHTRVYQKARERLDSLYKAAQRGEVTDEKWEEARENIWAMIRGASN